MRRIIVLILLSLLTSPMVYSEDYDVYDTYGKRTGMLRGRGSSVHVIENRSPSPSFVDVLGQLGQLRQLRAQKELLESQQQLLEMQKKLLEQQKVTGQKVATPATSAQVEAVLAVFYDDKLYEDFLNGLSDDELLAFWKLNAQTVAHVHLSKEAASTLSREDAKSSLMAMWEADKEEARLRLKSLSGETLSILGLDQLRGPDKEAWESTRSAWKEQIAEEIRRRY